VKQETEQERSAEQRERKHYDIRGVG
jgi:hypothetical protein